MDKATIQKRQAALRENRERVSTQIDQAKQQELMLIADRKVLSFGVVTGSADAKTKMIDMRQKQFNLRCELEELESGLKQLDGEIARNEDELNEIYRAERIGAAKRLIRERAAIAGEIEKQMDALTSAVAKYVGVADEIRAIFAELALPNATTRAILGTPMLKDYIQSRLRFLFAGSPADLLQSRQSLAALEHDARQTIEESIGDERKAVANG